MSSKEWLTIKEAAEHLGVTFNCLHKWGANGTSPPQYKLPSGSIRLARDEIDAWVKAQKRITHDGMAEDERSSQDS